MSIHARLNAIKTWHEKHQSGSEKAFLAPLSTEEIKAQKEAFPFEFPQALYEMYQWHNGMKNNAPFFNEYTFFPLEDAVDEYDLAQEEEMSLKASWFPVFGDQGSFFAVECDLLSPQRGCVYFCDVADEPHLWYDSLEKMLMTLRISFEQKAYFLDDDGILMQDFEAANKIREELNPKAVKLQFQTQEPLEEKIDEQPDGTKRLTTRYTEDHYSEQFFDAKGRKIGQCEYHGGELLRRDDWEYLSPTEVEITSENMMGMMMTTKTRATIKKDGTLEQTGMQTFMNGELVFDDAMMAELEAAADAEDFEEEEI